MGKWRRMSAPIGLDPSADASFGSVILGALFREFPWLVQGTRLTLPRKSHPVGQVLGMKPRQEVPHCCGITTGNGMLSVRSKENAPLSFLAAPVVVDGSVMPLLVRMPSVSHC